MMTHNMKSLLSPTVVHSIHVCPPITRESRTGPPVSTTPTQAPDPKLAKSPKPARRQLLGPAQFPSGAKIPSSALAVLGRALGLDGGQGGGGEGGAGTPTPAVEPRQWPPWNVGHYAVALHNQRSVPSWGPTTPATTATPTPRSALSDVASAGSAATPATPSSVNEEVLRIVSTGVQVLGIGPAKQCLHLAFTARLASELQESRANQVGG
jgi:hypothetical protein